MDLLAILKDPENKDKTARELLSQFNGFQIRWVANHPEFMDFEMDARFQNLPDEMKVGLREVWDRVVELARDAAATRRDCYIKMGTRFSWLIQEYMIFGHLDDEDAFWDLVEAYELEGFFTRVKKAMYECETYEGDEGPFGWFFFVCSSKIDSKKVEAMLENYRRKLCFKYKDYQALMDQEVTKVLEELD